MMFVMQIAALCAFVTPNFDIALSLVSALNASFQIFCGFIILLKDLDPFWRAFQWISFYRYGLAALVVTELENLSVPLQESIQLKPVPPLALRTPYRTPYDARVSVICPSA